MTNYITTQMYNEYISRINKVQDYIESNINKSLSLDELADISGFSKYHFCRIFKAIVNETILSYINRIRLERAVGLLLYNFTMSITEIAMTLGYSDSAVFARAFKNRFGISASKLRQQCSKNSKIDSKNGKAIIKLQLYHKRVGGQCRKNTTIKGKVVVRTINEIKAIYYRHNGSYSELSKIFKRRLDKLISWGMAREVVDINDLKPFAIYHDNPEFTDDDNLKTSICLAIDDNIKVAGQIGKLTIPSGKYAIGYFEISQDEYPEAWDYMYGEWLIQSGFQPDKGFAIEMYKNDPSTHPENKHIVEIYVPVRQL
ncbi:GyrI-like domain-containing protein [Clostridiaceae bacterium M8S5]|nr:GyrI-like domain-containing protein [Clostridiaceae bacterium M8S5]